MDDQLSDHDLLVTLHEQMKQVRIDIKDLKDNFSSRLDTVERRKVWIEDFMAHKQECALISDGMAKRLASLELTRAKTDGSWSATHLIFAAIMTLLGILVTYFATKGGL